MAKKLKIGAKHVGYTLVPHQPGADCLSTGAFAIAFKAQADDGTPVFFKQYYNKLTRACSWFPAYMSYHEDLQGRIRGDRVVRDVCYRFIGMHDLDKTLGSAMVFEWVEGGMDLEAALKRPDIDWPQRVVFAKVLMHALTQIHRVGIIHCDLKPANAMLFRAPDIAMKWRLRLVDMDWSILAERPAPWHGKEAYVSTPGYESPEHKTGKTPITASDVYTAALILGEIIGQGKDKPFALREPIPGADQAAVVAILGRCLEHDPARRPTAEQVRDVLNGRSDTSAKPSPRPKPPAPHTPVPDPKPAPTPPAPPRPVLPTVPTPGTATCAKGLGLLLEGPGGNSDVFRGGFSLNSPTVSRVLGEKEASLWHVLQMKVVMHDGVWMVEDDPAPGSRNQSLHNGAAITSRQPLVDGDKLAVGNLAKGVVRASITVRLVP